MCQNTMTHNIARTLASMFNVPFKSCKASSLKQMAELMASGEMS